MAGTSSSAAGATLGVFAKRNVKYLSSFKQLLSLASSDELFFQSISLEIISALSALAFSKRPSKKDLAASKWAL